MAERSPFRVLKLQEQSAWSVVLGLKLMVAPLQLILNYLLHCEAKRTKDTRNFNVILFLKNVHSFLKIVSGKGSFFSCKESKVAFKEMNKKI